MSVTITRYNENVGRGKGENWRENCEHSCCGVGCRRTACLTAAAAEASAAAVLNDVYLTQHPGDPAAAAALNHEHERDDADARRIARQARGGEPPDAWGE